TERGREVLTHRTEVPHARMVPRIRPHAHRQRHQPIEDHVPIGRNLITLRQAAARHQPPPNVHQGTPTNRGRPRFTLRPPNRQVAGAAATGPDLVAHRPSPPFVIAQPFERTPTTLSKTIAES